jgi:hypothetical protein
MGAGGSCGVVLAGAPPPPRRTRPFLRRPMPAAELAPARIPPDAAVLAYVAPRPSWSRRPARTAKALAPPQLAVAPVYDRRRSVVAPVGACPDAGRERRNWWGTPQLWGLRPCAAGRGVTSCLLPSGRSLVPRDCSCSWSRRIVRERLSQRPVLLAVAAISHRQRAAARKQISPLQGERVPDEGGRVRGLVLTQNLPVSR